MNIKDLHSHEKSVSAIPLFKGEGTVTALQILKEEILKEHTTKISALLVCIIGEVIFENENGIKEIMKSGDYVNIAPMVTHWVTGVIDSHLVLVK